MGRSQAVDVAVLGGGAVGLAVAWEARRAGLSVTLVDRGELAQGASHVAAGMLAPVSEAEFGESGRRGLELGLAGASCWPGWASRLAEASGLDPGLRPSGTLMVARDRDQAEALGRELALRERLELSALRLLPSQARRLEGALAPGLRLALELPDDHSVDPRVLATALVGATQRAGVVLRPGTGVADLLVSPGAKRVEGLVLGSGERLSAGAVVVAGGAWSATLPFASAPGLRDALRVPVRPVKGQILRLRDPAGPGLLGRVVRFDGGYLVPRSDGGYVLGATVEERGFDTTVTAGAVWKLLDDAAAHVPGVWELELTECSAGLRPGTPDNLPIVGPAPEAPGLLWATGHHRNGILLAPLTAELILGWLDAGRHPSPSLAAVCAPERFAEQRPEAPAPGPQTPARASALEPSAPAHAR